jgi:hypothetical protein
MYLQMADEEDKKTMESWKADADGILIFVSSRHSNMVLRINPRSKTGLFSAAVATLVAVAVQDLRPSSQDISAFYLAKMYQLSAGSNGSQFLLPSTLPDPSVPFSPPTYAVWVNSLWFLSLVISLTCALLATLLQQWARRYMKITQKRYSVHRRARIRAFFAEGVDKLYLPCAVEALPALLHLSLSLFFAGLAVFLFNINHTVFKVAVSWVGFCTGIYVCITFVPMYRHDSPYYAPLSSTVWCLYTGTLSAVFGILKTITHRLYDTQHLNLSTDLRARSLWWRYQRRILRGMEKDIEETALKVSSEIDGRALVWTFESLDEDHELERFFAGIPGFCSSNVVDDPQSSLAKLNTEMMRQALTGFLNRTLLSNQVSEAVKKRRLVICVRVIDAVHLSRAAWDILDIFLEPQHAQFRSVELGHSLISWGDNNDRKTALCAQGIIAYIVANAPQRDELWFALTMHHLGISESVLQGYLAHGDSVLLANLIHITRQLFHNVLRTDRAEILKILPRVASLRVENAIPELKHNFCELWNEIVLQARTGEQGILLYILKATRHIYRALHRDTDPTPTPFSASTHDPTILRQLSPYHLCSTPSHRSDSASNLNKADSRTAEMARTPTTSLTLPHRDVVPSVAKYDLSPTWSLDHTVPYLADEPARDEVPETLQRRITPFASSLHPTPDGLPYGAASSPLQGITDPSVSSMANPVSRSTSNNGATLRCIWNATNTDPPSFVPATEYISSPTPIPAINTAGPATLHIPASPTVNQLDRTPPHGGSVSPSSFQIDAASSPLTPRTNSELDAIMGIGPLGTPTPDDTLDPNPRVVSPSLAPSSTCITEESSRTRDHDLSKNSAEFSQ